MKKIQLGFSLIELMIVVVIVGLLAAVAVPVYQDYMVKAKLSRVQSTIQPIQMALAVYYQENGKFMASANTGISRSTFWSSLGLINGATMPQEVDGASFKIDGTVGSGDVVDLTLALQNIKAVSIDGKNLVLRGQAVNMAMTWTCRSTTITDASAKKYFGC